MVQAQPAEVDEQTPESQPEQVEEQVEDAVEVVEDDAPSDVVQDDSPESLPVPDAETQDPTDIEGLKQRYPWLDGKLVDQRKVDRNAGAQSEGVRLRREAGTRDQTSTSVRRIIDSLPRNDDGLIDPNEIPDDAFAFTYELARVNSAFELAKELPDRLLGEYEIPVTIREAAIELREANDLDGYVRALVDGAVQSGKGKLRLADIPDGTALRQDIDAEVTRRLESEMTARNIEAQPQSNGDRPQPGGGTPLAQNETFDMTTLVGISKAYRAGQLDETGYRTKWGEIIASS